MITDRHSQIRAFALLAPVVIAAAAVAVSALAARSPRRHALERAPAEPLPPQVVVSLQDSVEPEFTASNIRAARRLVPDSPVWLVPADGEECLVRLLSPLAEDSNFPPAVSQRCATLADAGRGKLVGTRSLTTSGHRAVNSEVVGLAPPGAPWVEVRSKDGRSVRAPVYVGGGYILRAREPNRLIAPAGGRRESIPLSFYETTK